VALQTQYSQISKGIKKKIITLSKKVKQSITDTNLSSNDIISGLFSSTLVSTGKGGSAIGVAAVVFDFCLS
jgi:hypothetical protein